MRERVGDLLPKLSEADKELLQNATDFVGLNHYTTRFVAHAENQRDIHFYQVQESERIGIYIKISNNFSYYGFLMYIGRNLVPERSLILCQFNPKCSLNTAFKI